jgi:N-acetylmuramoyl-L-alanine amidase
VVARIITCGEWGAAAPHGTIALARTRPDKLIFHHTAGHHAELDHKPGETREEAIGYARAVQRSHFSRGWADTGNNFLVTRSGHILEGRHGSVAAILSGRCVISAHCPGQNDQPGIEHEHLGAEPMTHEQREASVWLMAWICRHAGIRPTEIYGHRTFFATACPSDALAPEIPKLRLEVVRALNQEPAVQEPVPIPNWWWAWAEWKLRGGSGPRPTTAPTLIPPWAWKRLERFIKRRKK